MAPTVTEERDMPVAPVALPDDAPHLLVVDDDRRIRDLLSRYLNSEGYRVTTADNAADARAKLAGLSFDLLILDVMMPGESGFDLVKSIRETSSVPILMLTARAEKESRISGLEIGADDYVAKPFSPREVVARVKAVLRRAAGQVRSAEHYTVGRLTVDMDAFQARCEDEVLDLSPTQLRMLAAMAAQPGRAFRRQELLEGSVEGFADERTVDAHVKNLRRRMGACGAQLETVRGVGYRLRP